MKSVLKVVLATALVVLFSNHVPTLVDHAFPSDVDAHGYQENLTVLTLDIDLAPMTEYWLKEVNERYRNAIVIEGHGNTKIIDGVPTWCVYTVTHPDGTPVADVIENIRRYEPFRRIVILSCNPDGLRLDGIPNISYSLENVWVIPDDQLSVAQNTYRDAVYGGGCGDIFEFVQQ